MSCLSARSDSCSLNVEVVIHVHVDKVYTVYWVCEVTERHMNIGYLFLFVVGKLPVLLWLHEQRNAWWVWKHGIASGVPEKDDFELWWGRSVPHVPPTLQIRSILHTLPPPTSRGVLCLSTGLSISLICLSFCLSVCSVFSVFSVIVLWCNDRSSYMYIGDYFGHMHNTIRIPWNYWQFLMLVANYLHLLFTQF